MKNTIGIFMIGIFFGLGITKTIDIISAPERVSQHQAMQGMTMGLEGKEGNEFDETFLEEMIIHHKGAIEMAESALKSSNRSEIKDLATGIISAQEKEIEQMKNWQSEWFK